MIESNNLNVGNVKQKLIRYALPLVGSSLFQAVYSIVDILIAGNFIGSRGVSAINNSSQIMTLMTQIAIGLTLGGNILIGQFFGGNEEVERKKASGNLLTLCIIIGAIVSIIIYILAPNIMTALRAPSLAEAITYLRICAIGYIMILCYNGCSAVLRALGNSKIPFICIGIGTTLNIFLDIMFVVGLHMGVEGTAIATVISQTVSFVIVLLYILKHHRFIGIQLKYLKLATDKVMQIFRLGIPCSIQWCIVSASWLVVTYFLNSYGLDVSAGNGISIKIKDFCQLFITAMSGATSTMIAQALGAKMFDRAKEVVREAMKVTFLMAIVIVIVIQIGAPFLVGLFTKDVKVVEHAVLNLRIEIVGQLFYAIFMIYHGLMSGAGHTWYMMGSSFVNCILARVILVLILNYFIGLPGVYLACMIAPISSIPIGFLYERSNIWRRTIVN